MSLIRVSRVNQVGADPAPRLKRNFKNSQKSTKSIHFNYLLLSMLLILPLKACDNNIRDK